MRQRLIFLSTLSLRRATFLYFVARRGREISIHALLAESDTDPINLSDIPAKFLSTLSLRRATGKAMPGIGHIIYFYPRSPCGERRSLPSVARNSKAFLSTLSLRRATMALALCFYFCWYFYPRSPCGERLTFHERRCII